MADITDQDHENSINGSFTWFGPIAINENGTEFEDSGAVKIPVSIIMIACMVVSVVGNVCTCAVIIRDRTMRTPTNCYLFNLAIADLTTTLFIPFEIYLMWDPDAYPFGEIGCIIHFLIWECLSNCSLLTIAAFTVERFLAVSKPFLRHKLSKKPRVYKIVAINWLISICFGIPDLFLIRLHQTNDQAYCYMTLPFHLKLVLVMEMCVFFVMPMTIIFVLYILIAIKIKSINVLNKTSPVNGKQYRDKTIVMLAAVAATFFFCWFPFFLLRLMLVAPVNKWSEFDRVVRILRYICMVNAYIYTAVNPILYSLMSSKFSRAFTEELQLDKAPKPVRAATLRSFLTQRGASGFTTQRNPTKTGEYFIELRVYNSREAERLPSEERWKIALTTLKVAADVNTPLWKAVSKLVQVGKEDFVKIQPIMYPSSQ